MKPISTTATLDIFDDAPRLSQADFDRATFRLADKAATRPEWQTAVRVADDGFPLFCTTCQVT